MRSRRQSFRIEYRYGEEDLRKIVDELARETVVKVGGPGAIRISATKITSDQVSMKCSS